MTNPINKDTIIEAHQRIKPHIHRTPILKSSQINSLFGCNIHFKCENFQKVGAFKSRGAINAIFSLNEAEKNNGVCTHSSGNHAQALARAAKIANIPAYIVMPNNSPKVKIDAVRNYGAEITFCEPNLAAREYTLETIIKQNKSIFIHPFNNWKVITGQATAAKELIEEHDNLDIIIAPVGGGGLLSGTALSTNYFSRNTLVFGAEPEKANDAFWSLKKGEIVPSNNPNTICDGLLTSLGDKTFSIISKYVDKIITCKEETIVAAMKLIYERMKIVIEPSSAVALAIIMENKNSFKNKNIGIILSGGNVDLDVFFNNFEV